MVIAAGTATRGAGAHMTRGLGVIYVKQPVCPVMPANHDKEAVMRLRAATVLAAVAALVAVAAPPALASRLAPGSGRAPAPAAGPVSAQIRYTTGGVPHILAHDWTSLGFGYGYAFAQDNLCTMANDYVTVEAQRSRYFGPTGVDIERGNGVVVSNLDSDLFFQQIIDSGVVQRLAQALSPTEKQVEAGYVRGYNAYLAHVGGSAGVPDPTCRGQAWVQPINLLDSYLRFYQLMLLSSSGAVIQGISEAAPPKAGASSAPASAAPTARTGRALVAALRARQRSLGSNAVAIGSAGTQDHRGLLLGNPHFPWIGTERFFQSQLTIPGKINVTGASLYGVPLSLIGHNASVAWSHTVSTAFRFTPFQLTLVPGHPTEYLQNGKAVAMTPRRVTIMAKQPDGSLAPVHHTFWWTRYGPMFNNLAGISLPWGTSQGFAFADVNAANLARAVNTWFGIDRATTTQQVLSILQKYQGIPWVNTIVSDREGVALYADIGAIPNVTDAKANACDTPLGQLTFAELGLPILDGSKTACNWANDPGAAAPGIFGPNHEPYLLRNDYVTNSNDSFWLSNPHQPLTGFARIIGSENTARTLRTRIGRLELAHPVTTPFGLNTANPTVRDALGDAIQVLNKAHVPVDTPLGAVQFVSYHGSHITIPGGPGDPDGIYNAIFENTEPGDSPTTPDTGSSFIQVVTWPAHGTCPVGATIVTYSESSNPASPHFADQTKLFSKKQFLPDR